MPWNFLNSIQGKKLVNGFAGYFSSRVHGVVSHWTPITLVSRNGRRREPIQLDTSGISADPYADSSHVTHESNVDEWKRRAEGSTNVCPRSDVISQPVGCKTTKNSFSFCIRYELSL